MGSAGDAVYCTLLMSDSYLPGTMALAHSLRDAGTKAKLACLVTLETLQSSTIDELKTLYDDIIPVTKIVNKTPANLYLMDRPDLISTFTKIALWRQTQYSHIVYIDADVVALRAPDELLKMDTNFAAVPDIGWPDCFNSGVLVLKPNMGDYYSLLALAQRGISFDGADQGLLNMHFRNWDRLSFGYNCTPSGNYQYVPAYRHFQSTVSLVHFIGQDKPWFMGRDTKRATGVYDELLGRWWASYDRHYRNPTTAYISGQGTAPSTVQQYVHGEKTSAGYGFSTVPAEDYLQLAPAPAPEPEAQVTTTESSLGEQPGVLESIQKGELEPTPTMQQRRFSAPQSEWDASRAPPPSGAKPEAENFPTTQYEMSEDKSLFQAPEKYPEPPKDMYYQVPETKPHPEARPPPIFPWEARQLKPTRVFPQAPPPPEPEPEPIAPAASVADTEGSAPDDGTPSTPPTAVTAADPWTTYTRTNAWDEMPDIERYIQAVQASRKGKVQVLINAEVQGEHALSPETTKATERRPSFKVTDFPTEVERPSLPVTPAPVRRPSFWGEERDELGELPAAEGVPKQEEWVCPLCKQSIPVPPQQLVQQYQLYQQNPVQRLEELQRRQSAVLEQGAQPDPKELPKRDMPGSVSAAEVGKAVESAEKAAAPAFIEPTFTAPATRLSVEEEGEPDPTATAGTAVEASA